MTLSEAVKKPYIATGLAVFAGLLAYRFLDLLWLAAVVTFVVVVVLSVLKKHGGAAGTWKWLLGQIDELWK